MAKHISFGTPVNDAERWAFGLLADELPADYFLLTNVEIPTKTGQAMEVDALVLGQWGVYVVDVKGYIGRLDAGLHAWQLDGRDVDNSLSKANYVARVLAGKLKHKVPVGVYAPWCQGMVFVTGRKGEEIELDKSGESLSIYTPDEIIAALTKEWGLTAPHKHPVSRAQKELVLDTIGQVALVESRNNKIQDFIKLKCLFLQEGLEVWQAEYNPGGWTAPWLLKILQPIEFSDAADAERHEERLRDEFRRLQALSGLSAVPYSAPLIQDGEQLVLPIRMPRGLPLHLLKLADLSVYQLLEVLRRSITALKQIHRRGFTVGGWAENCVFVSDGGDVEFIDIRSDVTEDEDIQAYAARFSAIAEATGQPRVYQWFRAAARGGAGDADALRADLSALIEQGVCEVDTAKFSAMPGAVIDHHYRLLEQTAKAEHSELWKAAHILGNYPVAVSLYHGSDASWSMLSSLYRSLSRISHPAVEQVLALGQLPGGESLYTVRRWLAGVSLDAIGAIEPGQPLRWFAKLLSALNYLHQLDIYHGGICPQNIIVDGDEVTLVNFGLGLDIAASRYASQYADPAFWAEEGEAERDIYGLVASFIDVLTPLALKGDMGPEGMLNALHQFDRAYLGDTLFDCCEAVLTFKAQIDPASCYLRQFGLDDWLDVNFR
ncbi:NERD domain-containing protein [Shewanella sp. JM162201]|uniref:NERD domain-containing protein n=1 Tax=Shewanella jiangmenensis TaxID=2837387 RepID=A0ABS5V0N6_9GAMM|nr:NERD domain-containing protein kinase family protein [Shewanella jiangmenensis]MBT1443161.1 NERD domain-containing protein [Shewanella jiangmenensis]